ncbi:MAG: CrcB protein [Rhodobacteraceae bacterium HLUCCA12]|nr:MAG: CrcB protein [Rhodobacteraceae bacterium HLUCCA12]
MLMNLTLVALGGAAGSAMRYLVVLTAARIFGPAAPLGTVAVNVLGSFLIGVAVVVLADGRAWAYPLLVAGFLGGFTTFSAFSLETFRLWEAGHSALAMAYVAGSVGLGLVALVAGLAAGRVIA